MKKAALALVAASLLGTAATAQSWGPPPQQFWNGNSENPIERLHTLKIRIEMSYRAGQIDGREAHHAMDEVGHTYDWIKRMHYEDGGNLSPDQRAAVQSRIDQIVQEVHWDRPSFNR